MAENADRQPMDQPANAPAARLQAWMSLAAAALFGVSWRLWTPQTEFPQIPLVPGLMWPNAAAWGWLILAGSGLLWGLAAGVRGRPSGWGALLFIAGTVALAAEDQHRLQPWVIQFVWISAIVAGCRTRNPERLLRTLTVAIYGYSALSKFNALFAAQHGQVLWKGLCQALGVETGMISAEVQEWLPLTFPAAELAIGLGLCLPRLRRAAGIAAVLMHGVLILVFSPRGLNHEWGVLIWNGYFIGQALLLWVFAPAAGRSAASPAARWSAGEVVVAALLLIYPAARFAGVLDQWVGWSLYSPRSEVVRILLPRDPDRLPADFPEFTSRPYRMIQGDFQPLELAADRWSLAAVQVPLNPDVRVEAGVAVALCERFDVWDQLAVEYERRSLFDRTQRDRTVLRGRDDIRNWLSRFTVNVQPNGRYRGAAPQDGAPAETVNRTPADGDQADP